MRKPLPSPPLVHTLVFDFDGVFTNNKVWVDQSGVESVCCDRADGLALALIRAWYRKQDLHTDIFILSKETNPVVLARARKLRIACHSSVGDKLRFLETYLQARPSETASFAGMVYLGNDINDLPVMRRVGYAVAPADAHPRVKEVAHLVLEKRGGDGFVRAFVEQWLGLDRLTTEEIDELVSHC